MNNIFTGIIFLNHLPKSEVRLLLKVIWNCHYFGIRVWTTLMIVGIKSTKDVKFTDNAKNLRALEMACNATKFTISEIAIQLTGQTLKWLNSPLSARLGTSNDNLAMFHWKTAKPWFIHVLHNYVWENDNLNRMDAKFTFQHFCLAIESRRRWFCFRDSVGCFIAQCADIMFDCKLCNDIWVHFCLFKTLSLIEVKSLNYVMRISMMLLLVVWTHILIVRGKCYKWLANLKFFTYTID